MTDDIVFNRTTWYPATIMHAAQEVGIPLSRPDAVDTIDFNIRNLGHVHLRREKSWLTVRFYTPNVQLGAIDQLVGKLRELETHNITQVWLNFYFKGWVEERFDRADHGPGLMADIVTRLGQVIDRREEAGREREFRFESLGHDIPPIESLQLAKRIWQVSDGRLSPDVFERMMQSGLLRRSIVVAQDADAAVDFTYRCIGHGFDHWFGAGFSIDNIGRTRRAAHLDKRYAMAVAGDYASVLDEWRPRIGHINTSFARIDGAGDDVVLDYDRILLPFRLERPRRKTINAVWCFSETRREGVAL